MSYTLHILYIAYRVILCYNHNKVSYVTTNSFQFIIYATKIKIQLNFYLFIWYLLTG